MVIVTNIIMIFTAKMILLIMFYWVLVVRNVKLFFISVSIILALSGRVNE